MSQQRQKNVSVPSTIVLTEKYVLWKLFEKESRWFHEKFLWFQFKTTYKERAIESGKAFAKGVFPDEDIEMDFEDEDPVLRVRHFQDFFFWTFDLINDDLKFQYYDFCQRWIDGVDENPDTYYEKDQFALSKPAQVST